MRKLFAIVLFFVASISFVQAQMTANADSAFNLAKEKNKNILLVFSGSDWCAACMRFQKKILNDPEFARFSDSALIVLQADFPQSKKLPPETTRQNESLAAKYNPSGSFPLIVLLRPDQQVLAHLSYSNESPHDFINLIHPYLQ